MHKAIMFSPLGVGLLKRFDFCANGPPPMGYIYFRKTASFGGLPSLIYYERNTVTSFGDDS